MEGREESLPAMRSAAIEFVNAQTKRDTERKPYDAAAAPSWSNRWKADQAAEKPAPAIAAEAAAYLKVRTQVYAEETPAASPRRWRWCRRCRRRSTT